MPGATKQRLRLDVERMGGYFIVAVPRVDRDSTTAQG
jgi:hypothetical protein